jgi:hypothetical protein
MSKRVGHGVFGWNGQERRSDRYGAFVLVDSPYSGKHQASAKLDMVALKKVEGKRVRIACVVVETRQSGHVGDLFHNIYPTTPDVGEVVDLGVGILRLEDAEYPGEDRTAVVLEPGDDRKHFWIDPRKLYRLHDQTVDLFVEPTDADFTPRPGPQVRRQLRHG